MEFGFGGLWRHEMVKAQFWILGEGDTEMKPKERDDRLYAFQERYLHGACTSPSVGAGLRRNLKTEKAPFDMSSDSRGFRYNALTDMAGLVIILNPPSL